MTHPDLQDLLEQAIGEPPPSGPAADPRTLGRRVVRRRRTALAAAVAVVAVVGGGAATLALGSGGTDRTAQVATDPQTPTGTPTATAPTTAPVPSPSAPTPSTVFLTEVPVPGTDPGAAATTRLSDDHWADYRADGTLELLPDVTILQRIDDPIVSDVQSVALALARPGKADQWYLVELIGDFPSPTSSSTPAGEGYASLEAWVEHMDQPITDPIGPADGKGYGAVVYRNADGSLSGAGGVRILDQRSGVDVGAAFAPAGDASAALVTKGGKRIFVLVRSAYGSYEVWSSPQARTGATDLDGFLAYATQRYAAGKTLP